MSPVLWCDIGQHAFPANQPGKTTVKLEEQTKNQWGGYQPTDMVQDICASCARDSGMREMAAGARREVSQEELDAISDAQRDGTAAKSFLRRGNRALEAARAQGSAEQKLADARARDYDPDYVKFLEEKVHEPLETS